MAQEKVQATDAGLKVMYVTISADGTILAISTPTETISLSQKEIERIMATGKAEKKAAEVVEKFVRKEKDKDG